ncbi:hypothetical protein B0I35DRAFT_452990 [Stachybotrys elegans]|uniref:3-carboxymuconate cyclase n=1 Tax=Stachybotrys elegans TaxID=80388 RepID=A0A8K0SF39_9HYPO|nr:hypothetical protein B0I35DRAFT_452990 [Stachybotrys elegans]
MKFLLLLASCAFALPQNKPAGALYFLDSDPAGASVVSLPIRQNGLLGHPSRTSTGGLGLIGNNMNGPVTVDPVFSQGAVTIKGNRLFTVNPGSNTLAYFRIPRNDPTHPVLIDTIDTQGTVPNTVAYSDKNKLACVANTGSKPGVQCFRVSDCSSLQAVGGFKPLPVLNQTTPLLGPANTVSQVLFNPSETALFVTIKGDGTNDGFIFAYPVVDGQVQETPVQSRPAGVPVTFGFNFVTDSLAVVATPAYGAAFVDIGADFTATVSTQVRVPGQRAVCWTAFAEATQSTYLLDAGVAALTTVDPQTRAIARTVPGIPTANGYFDGVVGGTKLYALQASSGITIFDIQNRSNGPFTVDLTSFGNRASWIGMAVYMN